MKKNIVKLALVFISTVVLSFALFSPVPAAQPLTHEIIVSKDSDGNFITIADALSAITDASSTNRYRITVKPGTYNEVVSMKSFIDIVGSGSENTVITSNIDASVPHTYATVVMATDSNISNIAVENTSAGRGTALRIPEGVARTSVNGSKISTIGSGGTYYNVLLKGNNSFTIANSSLHVSGATGDLYGIFSDNRTGLPSVVVIRDVMVKAEGVIGSSSTVVGIGIYRDHDEAAIYDTVAIASGGGWAVGIENYCRNGSLTLNNVKVIAAEGSQHNSGFYNDGTACKTTIHNSEIISRNSTATQNTAVFGTAAEIEINNSQLISSLHSIQGQGDPGVVKIGGSMLSGTISGCTGCKIVNCWDGNYNLIPNR